MLARAQVPFDYPAPQVAARTAPGTPAIATTPRVEAEVAPLRGAPRVATPTAQPPVATATLTIPEPPPQATAKPAPPRAAAPPVPAGAQPGVAVVPEIRAVTVTRGDNLWRISRKVLGSGARYTQIYEANASQIRDPNRIWPGQIFVAPQL